MEANPILFRDLTYIFLAAVFGGLLAWRLKFPLILGFVLGGIVISPFTPGPHLSDLHTFEVFAEVGPLDERFAPAWFEDVDYCRRLAAAGHTIFVVPAARARHFGGASLEHVPFAEFIALWYRNMWFYARKWLRPGQAETLRWAIIFGMLLRIPLALAGVANLRLGRWSAARAYAGVMRKAFRRWSGA